MKLSKSQAILDAGGQIIGGKWELNKKHEIQYKTTGAKSQIQFKATVFDVKPGTLILTYTARMKNSRTVTRIHKLKGFWQADRKNRLTFLVQRQRGKNDVITFKNAWRVNSNQELEYTFRQENLKTKKKQIRRLVFKGFWGLDTKNRLTYYLKREGPSTFQFKGTFQTHTIRAREGAIRYQVGMEWIRKNKVQKVILRGRWRYSRKWGLYFEMEYRNGVKHRISFEGIYHFKKNHTLEVILKNPVGKRLGVELLIVRDFFEGEGQAFLSLFQSDEEIRVDAGVAFKW